MLKIAYQGTLYSNSYFAAEEFVAKNHPFDDFELIAAESSSNVVALLKSGKAHYGVLAKSNSTMGTVRETKEALKDHHYEVSETIYMPIEHYMFTLNANIEITEVRSHPQALGQCEGFVEKNFPGVIKSPIGDTARGARDIRENLERGVAVICSKAAGEHFGLQLIAESIQDSDDNCTKFIAITNLYSQKKTITDKLLIFLGERISFFRRYYIRRQLEGHWIYKVTPSVTSDEGLPCEILRLAQIERSKGQLALNGWIEGNKTKLFHSFFSDISLTNKDHIALHYSYQVDNIFGSGMSGYVIVESNNSWKDICVHLEGVYISLHKNGKRDARGRIEFKRITKESFLEKKLK